MAAKTAMGPVMLSLNLRGQFATWSGPSRKRASPQLDPAFLLGKASSVAVASLSVVDSLIDLTFLAWRERRSHDLSCPTAFHFYNPPSVTTAATPSCAFPPRTQTYWLDLEAKIETEASPPISAS